MDKLKNKDKVRTQAHCKHGFEINSHKSKLFWQKLKLKHVVKHLSSWRQVLKSLISS